MSKKEMIKKVMIAVDVSRRSEYARNYVSDLVNKLKGDLVIVNIIDNIDAIAAKNISNDFVSFSIDDYIKKEKQRRIELIEKFVQELDVAGDVKTIIRTGKPLAQLLDIINEENADLLIIGTRWGGLTSLLLGSVAEKLVRKCPIPVVCVPLLKK